MAALEQFSGAETLLEQPDTVLYRGLEEMDRDSSTLEWRSIDGSREVSLNYPDIVIHAVSTDTSVFPHLPCLFLVHALPGDDTPDDQQVTTDYRFVLPQEQQLDSAFLAISSCQELYPDSDLSSDSAESDNDNYFTTAEGLQHLSVEGEAVLSHLENILHIRDHDSEALQNGSIDQNLEQFEDADSG